MNRILISLALMLFIACANEQPGPEKTTIAVIPKGTTHEFWKSIHAGAVKAQRELDIEIIWKGPLKEDDREDQIALVENFISRGVSGIVLAPLDDTALRLPVANAVRSGIPVVIIDSGLQSDDFVSFVATDNYRGGRLAGADMAQRLNQKGQSHHAALSGRLCQHDETRTGIPRRNRRAFRHRNCLIKSTRRCHH